MVHVLQRQSTAVKAVLVIILVLALGVTYWLVSPLFLEGGMLNEEIDSEVTILSSGNLIRLDDAHWGEGEVRLVENSDGSLSVQFVEVSIANGPALVVYVSNKATFSGISDDPGTYLELGDLPATSGSFTLDLPRQPGFDIQSVLIWCDPFEVVFTYASLQV